MESGVRASRHIGRHRNLSVRGTVRAMAQSAMVPILGCPSRALGKIITARAATTTAERRRRPTVAPATEYRPWSR